MVKYLNGLIDNSESRNQWLTDQLDSYHNRITTLQTALDEQIEINKDLSLEISSNKQVYDNLIDTIYNLRNSVQNESTVNTELTNNSSVSELSNNLTQEHFDHVNRLNNEINELKARLGTAINRINQLTTIMDDSTKNLSDLNDQCENLIIKYAEFKTKNDS